MLTPKQTPKALLQLLETLVPYKNISFKTPYDGDKGRVEASSIYADAQVISSEVDSLHGGGTGRHVIALDIDCPAWFIPSSTPGHGHLYIARTMPWEKYEELLKLLAELHVIEPGYYDASKKRKATFLRLPWIRKGMENMRFTPDGIEDFLAEPDPEPILKPDLELDPF